MISAAYKALARLYHPDKAGNDPASVTIMQNINISYKILSDPQKKAEHDLWIAAQERNVTANVSSSASAKPQTAAAAAPAGVKGNAKADKALAEAQKWTAWSDRAAQEAKEAQGRVDKALADLAKAKPEDRSKWEAWITRTQQEAKEAKDKADKAAAQAAKAVAEAQAALADAK